MLPCDYQDLARRTECNQEAASRRRLFYDNEMDNRLLATRLHHSVLGLMGEVGELAGAVERWIHYGQELDVVNIREELGDSLWYIAEACNALGFSMEAVMVANIEKLRRRYPEKFSEEKAAEENRDRQAEREAIIEVSAQRQHSTTYGEAERLGQPSLTLDYPTRCRGCNWNVIHKTNETGLCADCFAKLKKEI